ncbi:aspartate kinase [Lactobacillus sp. ESL0731]|uniref:aspartate kinase n=1 Tax=unclassified Lactobacillus TaxID=2620435 RepID=UPI0023F85F02|nr:MULTISPECIES: aspartate kinase [unclassified Lactobacillus]WEV50906.1 aspartate kinase [Lactobacillus sp. ESL0700]WEV62037.1 aspartate kinase [Lactobacillus sp. ESL0731]
MKVVKFGGSSLADGPHFEKIIKIITADPERKVIVTSAPGKRDENDYKITDLLIEYAHRTLAHQDLSAIQEQIWQRYAAIGNHFSVPSEKMTRLKQILLDLPKKEYQTDDYLLATFKAHGEILNAHLLTLILQKLNLNAHFAGSGELGIEVTDNPQAAMILPDTYDNLAQYHLPAGYLIVPGFYGLTKQKQIATFSRGGSDITGAALARGFHADVYENFTDVDAIYAANPAIVAHPRAISKMTYREMRELSYAGFSVFHDEAILPAIAANIPINVKNTNHPRLKGTMIVPAKDFQPANVITGVATATHFSALYLHRYLLNKEVGFTLKLLQIFYKYHISYEHMPSGIDDLTVIFDNRQFTAGVREKMCQEIRTELQPDSLEWIDDYAIIMVVGEGMRNKVGVMAKIIEPLAAQNIGVHMINQGASRISIMLGTKRKDAPAAVRQIYNNFFTQKVAE